MILQEQIQNYIKANYLPSVLKQIPHNQDLSHGLLTLTIKIDLAKTLRQAKEIGTFIIGNFIEFNQLLENSLLEYMEENTIKAPSCGLNLNFAIQNCSLPRHNLESIQFLSSMFQQSNGVLVFLKDCRVMTIDQPEYYLSNWTEQWQNGCKCQQHVETIKRKQRLLEIVKQKSHNLKEVLVRSPLRCSQCGAKMKFLRMQDPIYLSCQKMKVTTSMKQDNSKEQSFHRGELPIFLDQPHTQTLVVGDTVDMCAFFSAEPHITRVNGEDITLQVGRSVYLICNYPPTKRTNANNVFLGSLTNLSWEYIHCADPRNQENITYNFKKLTETINQIKFPYLENNSLSTLKFSILNSLFNHLHFHPLNIMIVTEEVTFMEKSVRLPGVTIHKWPSQHDQPTLITFLAQCHNSVVLVTNPAKKDFESINSVLNETMMKNLNCTLWIIGEPNKEYHKDLNLQKIDIIIDLSVQKNFNICKEAYDDMIDVRLNSFIGRSNQLLQTLQKQRGQQEIQQYFNTSFQGIQQSQHELNEEAKVAEVLLQQYFLKAREYKHISTNSLKTIHKIASGFAYFRAFLRQKGKSSATEPRPNVLDAILAIFMQEETSRNKCSSNTLFSNQISKLMLNEQGMDISCWQYEVGDDNLLQESRRMIPRETMFKHMVGKLMALLYDGEVW